MRTTTLSLFFIVVAFQINHAQSQFGIEGGINIANMAITGNDDLDNKAITQLFFGVSPEFQIGEMFSISTDVNLSTKGYQWENNNTNGSIKSKHTYVTLAPQLKYKLSETLAIGAGVYAGVKLKNTQSFKVIKDFDYGVLASARVSFKPFYLKIAYEYGLQDILNIQWTNASGEPIDSKISNRNFQIGVGYLISQKME